MGTQLFNAPLTSSFQPTQAILLAAENLTLDFFFTVTVNANVAWYLEFTEGDPTAASTLWARETAEEDPGGGVVAMPLVIRTLQQNGGGVLAPGTYGISAQLVRKHMYARAQIRASVGTITTMQVVAPFGVPTISA